MPKKPKLLKNFEFYLGYVESQTQASLRWSHTTGFSIPAEALESIRVALPKEPRFGKRTTGQQFRDIFFSTNDEFDQEQVEALQAQGWVLWPGDRRIDINIVRVDEILDREYQLEDYYVFYKNQK